MTVAAFLEAAWNDHADRPDDVAARLAASTAMIGTPVDVAPYARIVVHVYGEHLGRYRDGIALLESLRALPASGAAAEPAAAIARGVATLAYASGDGAALAGLAGDDRVAVLAVASTMLAARREFQRAIAAYADAVALAQAGLPDRSPAIRALAIGGNQLAVALEAKPDRDAAETAGMVAAAEGGLAYWRQAGTWLEEERAHYRLARSLLQAGRARDAVASADRCVAVCAANDAPAFERFFAHAVLALAQRAAGDAAAFAAARAAALACHAEVPGDERRWCESDRAELGG